MSYYSLSPGYYRLRIFAKNNYDSVVVRRLIAVPESSYGCAVNLINGGFTVSDDSVTIQFAGSGALTGYTCFLDYLGNDAYDTECEMTFSIIIIIHVTFSIAHKKNIRERNSCKSILLKLRIIVGECMYSLI